MALEITGDQIFGAEWMAVRQNAWLGDIPGYGKTAQAIHACKLAGHQRILISCPSIGRYVWERELGKWWPGHPQLIVIETGRDAAKIPVRGTAPLIIVVSVDMPGNDKRLRQYLKANWFDVHIVDEAHYLKEKDSRRTRCFYGTDCAGGKHSLTARALFHWLLSASPCPNSAAELWTHLRCYWPHLIRDKNGHTLGYDDFVARYFLTKGTRFGVSIIGYRDRAGLQKILDEIMLRRTKITGVSEMIWRDHVSLKGEPEYLKELAEHDEIEDLQTVLEAAASRAEAADNGEDDFFHLATLRRLTALAKAKPAAELLRMDHSPGQKTIVYGVHREAMDVLERELAPLGCVRIDGRTSNRAKNAAVDAFNNDTGVSFMLGQVMTCRTAISLQAADRVRFFESSFCPEDNDQAARRGQRRDREKGSLIIDGIALAGSFDEKVQSVNLRKSALISELIGAAT